MKPNPTRKIFTLVMALSLPAFILSNPALSEPGDRVVKIAGMGAQSGVLRPFGLNRLCVPLRRRSTEPVA